MTTGIARIQHTSIGGEVTDINVLTAFQGEEVYFETKPLDFGRSDVDKEIFGLVFNITGRGSLEQIQCYVGYNQRLNDDIEWAGPYSLAEQDKAIWFRLPQSRYWYLKFEDLLPETNWKLSTIEVYGRMVDQSGRGPRGRL